MADEVAQVLECLWGGRETLVVVSTDLSHYHPYEVSRRVDAETAAKIEAFDTDLRHEQACGATPLNGLLGLARMARQPGVSAQRRRDYLDQIADSAETLSMIISDILEIGRAHV